MNITKITILAALAIGLLATDAALLVVYGVHREQPVLLAAILVNITASCAIGALLLVRRRLKPS